MDRRPKTNTWKAGAFALLAALTTGNGSGQTPARRFPLSAGDIRLAMQQRGLPVEGLQVKLAAAVTSSIANPELEIRSLTPSDKHNAQIVVACRSSSECLPFYVSATWSAEVNTAEMNTRFDRLAGTTRKAAIADQAPSLRAGSSALLLLEGERVHVRMRVVCVEAAETGERVRVTTPDRKQEYEAEVIAPGIVKGSF